MCGRRGQGERIPIHLCVAVALYQCEVLCHHVAARQCLQPRARLAALLTVPNCSKCLDRATYRSSLFALQYLAQKQAEALRAREAARAATQQLHSFLQDADAELDVSRKRQRI